MSPPLDAADAAPEMPDPLPDAQPPPPPEPPEQPVAPTCHEAPGAVLRLLSDVEYAGALKALFGDIANAAEPLPRVTLGFGTGNFPSDNVAEVAFKNASALANVFVGSAAFAAAFPCAESDAGARCAATFINDFGRLALRRPLTDEERLAWIALFERESGRADFATGVRAVLRSMLVHPDFLMHVERGQPTANTNTRRLTSHELANRLSFALARAPADAVLAKAADDGSLVQPAELARQVNRLLDRAAARKGIRSFYETWFRLDKVLLSHKDERRFPFWNKALAEQALEESLAFAERNFFEHDGDVAHLLTDRQARLTPQLAQLYGVTTSQGWAELPRSERAGILTRVAFLAASSGSLYPSISGRGAALVNQLLCADLPVPPADINFIPPEPAPEGLSRRQRLERAVDHDDCRNCHEMIDPPAFAFSHYDAVGAFQTFEDAIAIDAHGHFHMTVDEGEIEGEWKDAGEFSAVMAAQPAVKTCASRQLWLYLAGRMLDEGKDLCMLEHVNAAARKLNGRLKPILAEILNNPLFGQFSTEPFPQMTAQQAPISLPDGANGHQRAALQAAWQFRRVADAFPKGTKDILTDWNTVFTEMARRLSFTQADAP